MKTQLDARTRDMHFSSIFSILAITVIYVYGVKVWGSRIMKHRQPYKLNNIMKVYNVIQIVVNTYLSAKAFRHVATIQLDCRSIDYSNNPIASDQLFIMRSFFLLKLVDLIETIFFVLRKSFRQVSFLHLYHHAGMVLLAYGGFRYFGGGMSLWLPMLNGFVHSVMFAYYLLTSIDSSWKQSTVSKRTVTQIQLIQFCLYFMLSTYGLLSRCEYPIIVAYTFIQQNVFMIILFGHFYLNTYVFSKSKKVRNAKRPY